jgi:prepilin-type N-terminal cleavage/methylation domain-containing protein
MSRVDRIRARLRGERGFTLTELLVVVAVGSIVMLATVNLIDASVRGSDEVLDRVDGLQKGTRTRRRSSRAPTAR